MSRSISVELLLARIDAAKQEFAVQALSQMPEGPHAAQYHHGVIVGMENVKRNILAALEEADKPAGLKDGNVNGVPGGPRAYG